jgi:hypothetical protein
MSFITYVYVAGWDDMTPVEIICLMGVVASCHRVCLSTALAVVFSIK